MFAVEAASKAVDAQAEKFTLGTSDNLRRIAAAIQAHPEAIVDLVNAHEKDAA